MRNIKILYIILGFTMLMGCQSDNPTLPNSIGELIHGAYISFNGSYPDDDFFRFDYYPEYCGYDNFYNVIEIKKDGYISIKTVFCNDKCEEIITRKVLEGKLIEDQVTHDIYINAGESLTKLDILTCNNLLFVRFNSDKPKSNLDAYYIYHYYDVKCVFLENIGHHVNDLINFWQEEGLKISKDQNVPFVNIKYKYSPDFSWENDVESGKIPDHYSLYFQKRDDCFFDLTFYDNREKRTTHTLKCQPLLVFHDCIWLEIITANELNSGLVLEWKTDSYKIPYLWPILENQYPDMVHP